MTQPIRLLSLFSGIGAYEQALKQLAVPTDVVHFCEINTIAARAYSILHGISPEKNLGDVTQVNAHNLPDFDMMTYSFPCQDLSSLGKKAGLFLENGSQSRSGLVFDALRIADIKRPKMMIAENVRTLMGKRPEYVEARELILSELNVIGYNTYCKVLNSKHYGIPQSRNRTFMVSIRKDVDTGHFQFPDPVPLAISATEFHEPGVQDDEYYLRPSDMIYCNEMRIKKQYSSINADVIVCQTTKQGGRSNPQNFVRDERGLRVMTPGEMLSLQGFPAEFGKLLVKHGFTTNQVGTLSGNSVTVTVLEHLIWNLLCAMGELPSQLKASEHAA